MEGTGSRNTAVWRAIAAELIERAVSVFWSDEEGRFLKADDSRAGVLPPDEPRMIATVEQLRQARYYASTEAEFVRS